MSVKKTVFVVSLDMGTSNYAAAISKFVLENIDWNKHQQVCEDIALKATYSHVIGSQTSLNSQSHASVHTNIPTVLQAIRQHKKTPLESSSVYEKMFCMPELEHFIAQNRMELLFLDTADISDNPISQLHDFSNQLLQIVHEHIPPSTDWEAGESFSIAVLIEKQFASSGKQSRAFQANVGMIALAAATEMFWRARCLSALGEGVNVQIQTVNAAFKLQWLNIPKSITKSKPHRKKIAGLILLGLCRDSVMKESLVLKECLEIHPKKMDDVGDVMLQLWWWCFVCKKI